MPVMSRGVAETMGAGHRVEDELFLPGHLGCQGCGGALAMRMVLQAMGPKTMLVIPACCWAIIEGPFPYTGLKVPVLNVPFETAGAAAAGLRAALDAKGKTDIHVLAWAGDGGTYDIGLQSLSGAVERNDNILYVCYDNEAYMNTGVQRSGATPEGSWTTTTPVRTPKDRPKKNMIEILAAHRIPYAATATIAFPDDLAAKVHRAKEIRGARFLLIFAPCPTGWRMDSRYMITISRMAVDCNVFPLYEVFDGDRYHITVEPKGVPVREYFQMQGRFRHLGDREIEQAQKRVDFEWRRLLHKAMQEPFGM
ncbi:MAG: thiamine pyrophosphate-dependent enzyme [Planctomycetota bacterium]|nr:thiamine pyrophosphate-dependent enzyme [Planctomycetota bacterium]